MIISAFILNCVKISVPVVYSVCVCVHLLLEWWWWCWWWQNNYKVYVKVTEEVTRFRSCYLAFVWSC